MTHSARLAPLATLVLGLAAAPACTTLGPMPATTGVSAVPAGRPGVELQAAVAPAFHLSSATQGADAEGSATSQLAALVEPDRWLGLPGLIVGARGWGESGDAGFEPLLGYRAPLFEGRAAIAGVGYGTRMSGESSDASYEATRIGGELQLDATLFDGGFVAVHGQVGGSLTYISAEGRYCVAEGTGLGRDCDGPDDGQVATELDGAYAAGTAGLSLDFARRSQSAFHLARLAATTAFGRMPGLRDGVQVGGQLYTSFGVSLTVGFGEAN